MQRSDFKEKCRKAVEKYKFFKKLEIRVYSIYRYQV
jgi:hypothetical protein